MFRTVYDFAEFYKQPMGQMVHSVLSKRLTAWLGDCKAQRVIGIGYAHPYLESIRETSERALSIIPARLGAEAWHGQIVLAEESELPLETNSVDRVILIHSLEYAEILSSNLNEIWRVLKGNGRLIIITPNRMGFWARAVWSPFGHGSPATIDQLRYHMKEHKFIVERQGGALYTPPLRTRWILSASNTFEKFGAYLCPALAGVYMIEASKQIYADAQSGGGSKVAVRSRVPLSAVPEPLHFDDPLR